MNALLRRLGRGAYAAVLVVVSLALAVALGAAAERWSVRLDLTAAGEQRLAPRTERVVRAAREAEGEHRIVVAGPWSQLDARQRRELDDMLDMFESDGVAVSRIDPETTEGRAEFDRLMERLAEIDADRSAAQRAALEHAISAAGAARQFMGDQLAPTLGQLAELVPAEAPASVATALRERAALAAIGADAIGAAVAQAEDTLGAATSQRPLPAAEIAAPLAAALAERVGELERIDRDLMALVEAREQVGDRIANTADPVSHAVETRRDALAAAADELSRLRPTDAQRAAFALRQSSGVLALGPGGVSATTFESLFPEETTAARADLRRHAEERLAALLTAVVDPERPIVVFVHGEVRAFFADVPLLASTLRRLAERGIDAVEWAVAADPQRPVLAALDPEGARPVVYVALAPDSSQASAGQPGMSGAERSARYGAALAELAESGAAILMSMNPSILPATGAADGATAWLEAFGISARTGAPLLSENASARGRMVGNDVALLGDESGHPIAEAVAGLPAFFPWPIALDATDAPPGVRITPLYTVRGEPWWSEADWLRLWQTPRAQRPALPDPPGFDEDRDRRDGPWMLAAAVERRVPGVGRPQRLVVVGSNGWAIDQVTLATGTIDGRQVRLHPGNAELLEAAVLWLAGKDDQTGPSASARALPLVRPMEPDQIEELRWILLAGVPGGILVLGMLWRLIAG